MRKARATINFVNNILEIYNYLIDDNFIFICLINIQNILFEFQVVLLSIQGASQQLSHPG